MKAVTVGQLREALEDYADDLEVRIVHQPSWPLQEVLGGLFQNDDQACGFDGGCDLTAAAPLHSVGDSDFDHEFEGPGDAQVLFLVADGHPRDGSPYGDKSAWDGMRRL